MSSLRFFLSYYESSIEMWVDIVLGPIPDWEL